MNPEVQALLALIDAQLPIVSDIMEGLSDFNSVNLLADTRTKVLEAQSLYSSRYHFLLEAKKAIEDLSSNGFPDLPSVTVPETTLSDLDEQRRTMSAAFAHFSKLGDAVSGSITFGTPTKA